MTEAFDLWLNHSTSVIMVHMCTQVNLSKHAYLQYIYIHVYGKHVLLMLSRYPTPIPIPHPTPYLTVLFDPRKLPA